MFAPTDVPKSSNTFWLAGDGYVRVVQAEPQREIFLTGAAARLWEWIDDQVHTVVELVTLLAAEGVPPEQSTQTLERFRALGLITTENYLWKGGGAE